MSVPGYRFRPTPPSLLDMLRHGVADVAAVIPATILEEPAVQLPGPGAPLVVADPELVRELLGDRTGNFARNHMMRRLFRRTWGTGLAAAEGKSWQAQRRAAAPFFRPAAIAAQAEGFIRATDDVLAEYADGGSVELTSLARRIVARVVFGQLVAAGDEADADEIAHLMPEYVALVSAFGPADLAPLPESWIDGLRGLHNARSTTRIAAISHAIAAARKDKERSDDLIDMLAPVGPVEDNIRGLLPAAMDSTAAGVTWALYCLAKMPDWQSRCLESGPDTLRPFVREVLRLFPPGPHLVRTAAMDDALGGYRVRKGQTIVASIYAMHRHRAHWHNPDSFDPSRFGPGAPRQVAYLPFGTGERMCIAAQFAELEILTIAHRIARRFRIEVEERPSVSLKVATRPVGAVPARLVPRGT